MFEISRYLSFSRQAESVEVSQPFIPKCVAESIESRVGKLSQGSLEHFTAYRKYFENHAPFYLPCGTFKHDLKSDRIFVKLNDSGTTKIVKLTRDAKFSIEGGKLALRVDQYTKEMVTCSFLPNLDCYQKDLITGELVPFQNLVGSLLVNVFLATQLINTISAIFCVVKMLYFTGKVSFNVASVPFNSSSCNKDFWQVQARDITRIVQAPFLLIGLILTPFYGIINPYGGARLYIALEETLYEGNAFAANEKALYGSSTQERLEIGYYKKDEGHSFSSFSKEIEALAAKNQHLLPFSYKVGKTSVKFGR